MELNHDTIYSRKLYLLGFLLTGLPYLHYKGYERYAEPHHHPTWAHIQDILDTVLQLINHIVM